MLSHFSHVYYAYSIMSAYLSVSFAILAHFSRPLGCKQLYLDQRPPIHTIRHAPEAPTLPYRATALKGWALGTLMLSSLLTKARMWRTPPLGIRGGPCVLTSRVPLFSLVTTTTPGAAHRNLKYPGIAALSIISLRRRPLFGRRRSFMRPSPSPCSSQGLANAPQPPRVPDRAVAPPPLYALTQTSAIRTA